MNLIQLRKAKGLTQSKLASKINCHQTMISKIENSKTTPSFIVMENLAIALDVDLQTIVECFAKKEEEKEE